MAHLAIAEIGGLPLWLAQFLREGRLIIFGLLIVITSIFYPQGIITPELLRRLKRSPKLPQVSERS